MSKVSIRDDDKVLLASKGARKTDTNNNMTERSLRGQGGWRRGQRRGSSK